MKALATPPTPDGVMSSPSTSLDRAARINSVETSRLRELTSGEMSRHAPVQLLDEASEMTVNAWTSFINNLGLGSVCKLVCVCGAHRNMALRAIGTASCRSLQRCSGFSDQGAHCSQTLEGV